ncbi:MAG: DUF1559 domain-containing protein [Planctomycetaceae bacterium]
MPVTVTCECGQVTELADLQQSDDAAVVADRVCPICGRALLARAPVGKRMFQQLWQSQAGDDRVSDVLAEPPDAEGVAEPSASEPSITEPSSTNPTPARRSLWEVMRGGTDAPQSSEPVNDPLANDSLADAVKPKGLWSVMQATAPTPSRDADAVGEPKVGSPRAQTLESSRHIPSAVSQTSADGTWNVPATVSEPVDLVVPSVPPVLSAEKKLAQAASLAAMTHIQSTWQPEPEPEPSDEDEREWSRRAVVALSFAVTAALASGLSYRPEWWWRFPALVIGLMAVVLGFMASSDVRRSRGRLKGCWLARGSVLLGTFGMFLAPIVFADLGEQARANAGREQIEGRLRRMGQALDQLHAQQGHYPEAALKGRDAHGDNVPMHGWMTPLLPALGYEQIYRQIDLRQPYDAPANAPAMQQSIPEFSLPRRKPSRSPRGFSLAHFAGVGGQDVREPTGLVHLGLFSDGGPVRRELITDGLSQTIIVGEIRDAYPPWGEPGNVREIGEGLNRQFRGFGNESGTGATFLHADGSAKFYSNKTDKRVLQRLETRDGAEAE